MGWRGRRRLASSHMADLPEVSEGLLAGDSGGDTRPSQASPWFEFLMVD